MSEMVQAIMTEVERLIRTLGYCQGVKANLHLKTAALNLRVSLLRRAGLQEDDQRPPHLPDLL